MGMIGHGIGHGHCQHTAQDLNSHQSRHRDLHPSPPADHGRCYELYGHFSQLTIPVL